MGFCSGGEAACFYGWPLCCRRTAFLADEEVERLVMLLLKCDFYTFIQQVP